MHNRISQRLLYWVSLNSGVERKWFFVSADVGGCCSEGLTCGPDGCKSDTLLFHDDGLLLCRDLSNRKEGHSVTLKACTWITQRWMRAQGLERLCDGNETGNECIAVISKPSKASYFADSYRLPCFLQSYTSFLSRADSLLPDRIMLISTVN